MFLPLGPVSSSMCSYAFEPLPEDGAQRLDGLDHVAAERGAHDLAPRRNQFARERLFERLNAAVGDEFGIVFDLAQQRLLRRDREHVGLGHAQVAAVSRTWRSISRSTSSHGRRPSHKPSILLSTTSRPFAGAVPAVADVIVPHLDVGLGDAGVGGEHVHHRLRVG